MTQSATEAQPKAKKNKLSSGFFRFVLTRFLLIIPTVFILVTIVFFVMRATGDPISAALGGRLTPEELQKRIHAAGYDRPLIVQYIDYLGGLLHGDLGTTLTDNQKVSTILTHYGAATFELAFLALIVAVIVGIGVGVAFVESQVSENILMQRFALFFSLLDHSSSEKSSHLPSEY